MKLQRLKTLSPALNLRIAAPPPDDGGKYGKGRGGRPWRRIREEVLRRDGYQCQRCRAKGRVTLATEVDHMTPIFEGGSDALSNLQAICFACHQVKTQAETKRAIAQAKGS